MFDLCVDVLFPIRAQGVTGGFCFVFLLRATWGALKKCSSVVFLMRDQLDYLLSSSRSVGMRACWFFFPCRFLSSSFVLFHPAWAGQCCDVSFSRGAAQSEVVHYRSPRGKDAHHTRMKRERRLPRTRGPAPDDDEKKWVGGLEEPKRSGAKDTEWEKRINEYGMASSIHPSRAL